MVTASFPVYAGDTVLGVASRDITVKQLAQSVLSHLVDGGHASAIIVDRHGLVIDASSPRLAVELDEVNTAAGAAVLHYRDSSGLRQLNADAAVASSDVAINDVVERVIDTVGNGSADAVVRFAVGEILVLAAPIPSTGWLVVMMIGGDAHLL